MEIPARLGVSGPAILSHFWRFVNTFFIRQNDEKPQSEKLRFPARKREREKMEESGMGLIIKFLIILMFLRILIFE